MNTTKRMPLLFVGHGNPMNVITDNQFTQAWSGLGKKLPTPKTIVCISAHWLTTGTKISGVSQPTMIYDFYGFPDEMYHLEYPVDGDPQLAADIHNQYGDIKIDSNRGIDHGAWTVLKIMFPEANIPVVQLSVDMSVSPREQFNLISKLKYLRDEGVLIIGSGNIVHNLGMASMDHQPYDWALQFEVKAKNLIESGEVETLINYETLGTNALMSIPTDDHYRPLLNSLALTYPDEKPVFFNQGIDLASVSMLSVSWGLNSEL